MTREASSPCGCSCGCSELSPSRRHCRTCGAAVCENCRRLAPWEHRRGPRYDCRPCVDGTGFQATGFAPPPCVSPETRERTARLLAELEPPSSS